MNTNDIIAHYAAERLQLMLELQQARARITELEAEQKEVK
jgi:hypothetical protein